VYTGETQCGNFECISERQCCRKTYYTGRNCTKAPPPESANNNCFIDNFCDANGFCQYSFVPTGGACALTPAQLIAGGYTQPGCVPTGNCTAVVGGTPGATRCTPVSGTAVTKVTGFTLVDSEAPNTTYELATFSTAYTMDYKALGRCNYNIRVDTQDCGASKVDSVLIEWDLNVPRKGINNGNISFCEEYTPYAVFGDVQRTTPLKELGPYSPLFNDVTFFLGTHTLKATPYSGPKCNGTAGTPLSATVLVTSEGSAACPGTVANLEIFNKVTNKAVGSLVDYDVGGSRATYCFPTNYTINACVAPCRDGEIKWVLWELYRPYNKTSSLKIFTYNDTTKIGFALDEEKPSPQLTDGNYLLVVTPFGNIWNNSVVPAKLLSSYGPGTPQYIRFTIDCIPDVPV
jgi:hypothetical protein